MEKVYPFMTNLRLLYGISSKCATYNYEMGSLSLTGGSKSEMIQTFSKIFVACKTNNTIQKILRDSIDKKKRKYDWSI
jgi:hypothetical protein